MFKYPRVLAIFFRKKKQKQKKNFFPNSQASLTAQQASMNQSSSHGTGSNTPQPPGSGSVNLAVNSAAAQHAKVLAAQSPAQRAAAARAAFRQQADKQLMVGSFSLNLLHSRTCNFFLKL